MNTRKYWIILLLVVVMAFGATAAFAQNGAGNGGAGGTGTGGQGNGYRGGQNTDVVRGSNGGGLMLNLPAASPVPPTQDVVDLMIDGWMDEQHAYAVYAALIDQFGAVRPFTNIQSSEAQHIAAWETLFDRYGIDIPAVPAFDVPEFSSVSEACSVGASAEIANFDLYDTMLAAFDEYPDLQYVAQMLRDASEFSHLPAFERCAS